jgi:mono/diheme cytochrome c family protein
MIMFREAMAVLLGQCLSAIASAQARQARSAGQNISVGLCGACHGEVTPLA